MLATIVMVEKTEMMRTNIVLILMLVFGAQVVHAEIYKRVDVEGRITYSNIQLNNSVPIKVGNAPKKRAKRVAPTAKPARKQYTAKVSKQMQSQRDLTRKEILLDEFSSEQAALIESEQAYLDGKSNPEIYHKKNANGTTSTFRNVPKFNAKMKNLQAEIDSHRRNIALLKKEIAAL